MVRERRGEKEMNGRLIPDSTLDQAKRLRNDCTKISEDRQQQSLNCKESNLYLCPDQKNWLC
jgi:hypothetical protein